jgi:hypothetical protein
MTQRILITGAKIARTALLAVAWAAAGCSSMAPFRDATVPAKGDQRTTAGIIVDTRASSVSESRNEWRNFDGRDVQVSIYTGQVVPFSVPSIFIGREHGLGGGRALGYELQIGWLRTWLAQAWPGPTLDRALTVEASGGLGGGGGALGLHASAEIGSAWALGSSLRGGWLYQQINCSCGSGTITAMGHSTGAYVDIMLGVIRRTDSSILAVVSEVLAWRMLKVSGQRGAVSLGLIYRHPFFHPHSWSGAGLQWDPHHHPWFGLSLGLQ